MKPVLPKAWNPPPVVQTARFTPVFDRTLNAARMTHLMPETYGWAKERNEWPADFGTELQAPWQCASYAAVNGFQGFCRANHRNAYRGMDPSSIHDDAQELDGLEGGAAEVATTVEAAMEAICETANAGMREPWIYWAKVPVDLVGCWLKGISPVVVDLRWPSGWESYSVLWKTLLWTHQNDPKARHAVTLIGHEPQKRVKLFGRNPRTRAFALQDPSKGEKIYIEAAAMARNWVGGYGFILATRLERLAALERRDPNPQPWA